jgi:hypothetical protein
VLLVRLPCQLITSRLSITVQLQFPNRLRGTEAYISGTCAHYFSRGIAGNLAFFKSLNSMQKNNLPGKQESNFATPICSFLPKT